MPGFLLVAILVLLGAGLLGTLFRQKLNDEMHRPLGPTLPVFATAFPLPVSHTGEPAELPSISPTLPAGDSENNPDLGNTPSAIPATLEPTPAPLCDGPPQMTILAIGADSVDSEYEYGLADVIRVVRVDFVTPGVSVLTVPRGLWVAIPALGNGEMARYLANYYGAPLDPVSGEPISLSVAHGLINVSYFYGNLFDLPGLGPATLAHTL
nr:hypothetical protein [Anaerolineae bacterium]